MDKMEWERMYRVYREWNGIELKKEDETCLTVRLKEDS